MKYGHIHTFLGWLQVTGVYTVGQELKEYWCRTGRGLNARSWMIGKEQYNAILLGGNIE